MNVVQALAVAAAALAISGEPMGMNLTMAEARMTAIVAQGEALTERIAVRAAGPLAPPTSCARQERTDGVHALPDMSIHAASHAARL